MPIDRVVLRARLWTALLDNKSSHVVGQRSRSSTRTQPQPHNTVPCNVYNDCLYEPSGGASYFVLRVFLLWSCVSGFLGFNTYSFRSVPVYSGCLVPSAGPMIFFSSDSPLKGSGQAFVN